MDSDGRRGVDPLNAGLRERVWERDKGICQRCKKQLYFIETIDPYEDALEEFYALQDIPIYKWSRGCWKCGKQTDVISYHLCVASSRTIGDIEKIDIELMRRYPFVKKVYSKTQKETVIANTCQHCGALQGNWFIGEEDLTEMTPSELEEHIDTKLENTLELADFKLSEEGLDPYDYEERLRFDIHHIDINPNNNDLENLVVLCRKCHLELHSEVRKRTKKRGAARGGER
jgi:5-methylcytosine-specific restriction endonuclease McrA